MLSTTCEETTFWVAVLSSTVGYSLPSPKLWKKISTKEQIFISLVGPSGSGKLHYIFDWLKLGTFHPKFDKKFYFYQHY